MILRLKKDNGLPRRSVNGVIFFIDRPVEVSDDFEYKRFNLYLEKLSKEEATSVKQEDSIDEEQDEIKEEKDSSELTKKELIEAILIKYPEEYTKTDLNKLRKEVLIMTLKGELE